MQKKKIDYQKIMETRNASNAFANLIGLKITEISDGHCTCEMAITDDMKNPIQSVHGGVLFTIADVTGGGAAASHGFASRNRHNKADCHCTGIKGRTQPLSI